VPFEAVDVVESRLPELTASIAGGQLLLLENLGVDADHEHVLVVRAVEDADPAPLRQRAHVAPQEIVIQLLVRRLAN
jgi:hypothetical protein